MCLSDDNLYRFIIFVLETIKSTANNQLAQVINIVEG